MSTLSFLIFFSASSRLPLEHWLMNYSSLNTWVADIGNINFDKLHSINQMQ